MRGARTGVNACRLPLEEGQGGGELFAGADEVDLVSVVQTEVECGVVVDLGIAHNGGFVPSGLEDGAKPWRRKVASTSYTLGLMRVTPFGQFCLNRESGMRGLRTTLV